jgi:hypothetical protein
MRFEVLTAVLLKIHVVFSIVRPCQLVNSYRLGILCFGLKRSQVETHSVALCDV